jgi:hypothetical protein
MRGSGGHPKIGQSSEQFHYESRAAKVKGLDAPWRSQCHNAPIRIVTIAFAAVAVESRRRPRTSNHAAGHASLASLPQADGAADKIHRRKNGLVSHAREKSGRVGFEPTNRCSDDCPIFNRVP